jgi:MFS family permease
VALSTAAAAVTIYIAGTAVGTMIGGVIADRTPRHDMVAISGLAAAVLFMMLAATGTLGFSGTIASLVLAGLSAGMTAPSRDMLVRAITPPAAAGRIFGFVYSGLDAGSAVAPLLFGWLIDHGLPSAIFTANAVLVLLAVASILSFRRAMPRKAAAQA